MKVTNREWAKVEFTADDMAVLREAAKIVAAVKKGMEDNRACYANIGGTYYNQDELDEVQGCLDDFAMVSRNDEGNIIITLEGDD